MLTLFTNVGEHAGSGVPRRQMKGAGMDIRNHDRQIAFTFAGFVGVSSVLVG